MVIDKNVYNFSMAQLTRAVCQLTSGCVYRWLLYIAAGNKALRCGPVVHLCGALTRECINSGMYYWNGIFLVLTHFWLA